MGRLPAARFAMMELALLVVLLPIIGLILGVIAFFQGGKARDEIARLRGDIGLLHRRLEAIERSRELALPTAPQAPAAAEAPLAETAPTRTEPKAAAPEVAATVEPAMARAPEISVGRKTRSLPGFLERALAGNWLIWLGGAALMLGGAFLVKSAIDAGFFGPPARILAGLGVGAAMIAAGERIRRGDARADRAAGLAPSVLAGAGGSTIYAALYAAYGLYGLIPGFAALILLAAASAGLLAIAALHRTAPVAGLGLAGGFVAPILTASGEPQPAALFLYVFGVAAAGLVVARIMQWRSAGLIAIAGATLWPLVWLGAGDSIKGATALALYLPAFLALNAVVAGEAARAPLRLRKGSFADLRSARTPVAVFHLALIAVAGLGFLFLLKDGLSTSVILAQALLAIVAIGAARWRQGFALAPLVVAVSLAAAIALAGGRAANIAVGAAFAGLFAAGGALLFAREGARAPAAALIAFAPTAFLAALFIAGAAANPAPLWGGAGLALAFANLSLLMMLARRQGVEAAPGAASAFALGATFASSVGVAMATEGLWMSAGLAFQAPAIAWLWRRFRLRALEVAAASVAIIASARLFLFPDVFDGRIGALPFFNLLAPGYLLSAAGFWLAARWFEGGGLSLKRPTIQTLEAAAVALFAAFVSLSIRHALMGGALDARAPTLIEASLNIISWTMIAAFIRMRFGDTLSMARRLAHDALLAFAVATGAVGNLLALNPWWGDGGKIAGPPVANMLLLAYLAPAIAFAVTAYAARRAGVRWEARLVGAGAAIFVYVFLILSVRHAFHAPDLSAGDIGDGESWGYSIVTILYAAALLIVAALRRSALLRYAGFAALFAASGKVFLIDTAGLDGVLRATSFLGLGAALVAIAALFQRLGARAVEMKKR